MGRTKLASTISPNKTWEGALWSLAFCLAIAWATKILWTAAPYSLTWLLVTAVAVWVFGTVGDLFESQIKRDVEVKDSGHLLGPHGGVLDRLDATLFTVLAGYYVWVFLSGA